MAKRREIVDVGEPLEFFFTCVSHTHCLGTRLTTRIINDKTAKRCSAVPDKYACTRINNTLC